MAFVFLAVGLVVLTILYVRMIRREKPEPIGKLQAIVPVILGVVSTPLSFILFLLTGVLLVALGYSVEKVPPIVGSFVAAFAVAGFPEEIAKFAMMLIALLIFRKKVRNVYEVILIGAAVGFGFTLFEEFLYGSGNAVNAVGRLITVAAHMAFGIVMATHIGLARFKKANGEGGVAGEYALAIILPVVAHTLFDTFTGNNKLLDSTDDTTMMIGLVLGVIAFIAMFVWQIYVLRRLKKDADMSCAMKF